MLLRIEMDAEQMPVMVTDLIMDGNLGQPFLSQDVVTLDLKSSRMWLKPIR